MKLKKQRGVQRGDEEEKMRKCREQREGDKESQRYDLQRYLSINTHTHTCPAQCDQMNSEDRQRDLEHCEDTLCYLL